MENDFYYYIVNNSIDNNTLRVSKIPIISKIRKNKLPYSVNIFDGNSSEGPFDSLFDLKRRSIIYSNIKLQKHKERVLKSGNIEEIKNFIFTSVDSSYEKTFFGAMYHTMVGKISKRKVKGVHFYNPDEIKIIEKISINKNGVYSARIEKLNKNTGEWIIKEEITNFFPDEWSTNQLFHECSFAYSNRKNVSGKIYKSKTVGGITVTFIINESGEILTVYPDISVEES